MATQARTQQSLADLTLTVYMETMRDGRFFEGEAERCRREAEAAYADAGEMKVEGRSRVAQEDGRLLPQHERATDVRTNTFKAAQDAKGDHLYYTGQAQMYASLATMKFTKAAAILARLNPSSRG